MEEPQIHETMVLDSLAKYAQQIKFYCMTRPVLVYLRSDDKLYKSIAGLDFVTEITDSMDHEELRHLNEKKDKYPVYLANEHAMRGYDYRCTASNPL